VKAVAALGGNALLKRGEAMDADVQRRNIIHAAAVVARIARDHTVVVTHGNGPQVGLLALQSETSTAARPYPLDVLGAESEGMIGYMLEQELMGFLPKRAVATLLTQVVVNPGDPAFDHPSKPIGPSYAAEQARRLERERGWHMAQDGPMWRRVVPSPEPLRVIELPAIRLLMDAGAVVICAGGGGIPVAVTPGGALHGVEAVIDKDLSAALLAHQLGADALLLLTDVDAVYLDWGTRDSRPVHETTPDELKRHAFAPGSMRPKVQAACRFVEGGGRLAGIGRLEDAVAILEGVCGTIVRPTGMSLDFSPGHQARPGPAAGNS